MKTLLKAVEIWSPKTLGVLALDNAYYGDLISFKERSEQMSFKLGEGLPGKVWHTFAAVAAELKALRHFKRKGEAEEAGIGSCMALPVICGQELKSVVVMFFSNNAEDKGGVEVWENSKVDKEVLSLSSGAYNDLEHFKKLSKVINLPRNLGLPGICWAKQQPYFKANLGDTYSSFLPDPNAQRAGLTDGVCIPLEKEKGLVQIVTLLSSHEAPIARQFEIWAVDNNTQKAQFRSGYSQIYPNLSGHYRDVQFSATDSAPLATVLASSNAVVFYQPDYPGVLGANKTPLASPCALYLPVFKQQLLQFIVVFYL